MYSDNLIELTPQRGDMPIEWFDKSPAWGIPDKAYYKVYNDGSHYVGKLFLPRGCKHNITSDFANRSANDFDKKRKKRIRQPVDEYMDVIYPSAIQQGLKGKALENYLCAEVNNNYYVEDVDEYVQKQISRRWHNLYNRKKRLQRKADLNRWHYFVTITYADGKHTEEGFRRKLRRCLSNLSTRRGWRYMGVWENGTENDRLHFHALMYVPDGEMLGKIYEREDYSIRKHEMVKTNPNTFFETKFGRNDFKELSEMEMKQGNAIEYLLKYIGKTDGRIVYSRGIHTEILVELNDTDIACEMLDYVQKYVLFDDVIDWERDVMQFRYEQQSLFERLRL